MVNGKKIPDEGAKEILYYLPPELYQTADGDLKYFDLFKIYCLLSCIIVPGFLESSP